MRSALSPAGSIVILVGLAGCGEPRERPAALHESLGRERSAIVNGDVATSDASATAALLTNGRALCSGVLVAPRFVLTAAHCLEPAPDEVAFGAHLAVKLRVRRSIAHPAYAAPTLAHDLALVELAATPPIAPAPLAATDLTAAIVGQTVRVEGYGVVSARDTIADTLRGGAARAAALTDTHLEVRPGPALPCAGDSGGPVFANDALVAITSYGDDACADVAYAMRLDVERAFITDTIAHPLPDDPPPDDGGCSVRSGRADRTSRKSQTVWLALMLIVARRRRVTALRS